MSYEERLRTLRETAAEAARAMIGHGVKPSAYLYVINGEVNGSVTPAQFTAGRVRTALWLLGTTVQGMGTNVDTGEYETVCYPMMLSTSGDVVGMTLVTVMEARANGSLTTFPSSWQYCNFTSHVARNQGVYDQLMDEFQNYIRLAQEHAVSPH